MAVSQLFKVSTRQYSATEVRTRLQMAGVPITSEWREGSIYIFKIPSWANLETVRTYAYAPSVPISPDQPSEEYGEWIDPSTGLGYSGPRQDPSHVPPYQYRPPTPPISPYTGLIRPPPAQGVSQRPPFAETYRPFAEPRDVPVPITERLIPIPSPEHEIQGTVGFTTRRGEPITMLEVERRQRAEETRQRMIRGLTPPPRLLPGEKPGLFERIVSPLEFGKGAGTFFVTLPTTVEFFPEALAKGTEAIITKPSVTYDILKGQAEFAFEYPSYFAGGVAAAIATSKIISLPFKPRFTSALQMGKVTPTGKFKAISLTKLGRRKIPSVIVGRVEPKTGRGVSIIMTPKERFLAVSKTVPVFESKRFQLSVGKAAAIKITPDLKLKGKFDLSKGVFVTKRYPKEFTVLGITKAKGKLGRLAATFKGRKRGQLMAERVFEPRTPRELFVTHVELATKAAFKPKARPLYLTAGLLGLRQRQRLQPTISLKPRQVTMPSLRFVPTQRITPRAATRFFDASMLRMRQSQRQLAAAMQMASARMAKPMISITPRPISFPSITPFPLFPLERRKRRVKPIGEVKFTYKEIIRKMPSPEVVLGI